MAVVYIDGFDHGDITQCLLRYEGHNGTARVSKVASRTGTGIRIQNNSGSGFLEKSVASAGTYYVGVAMYFDYAGNFETAQGIITFMEGTTTHVDLRFSTGATSSTLTVTRNGTTLATGTTTIAKSTWYYIEMMVTVHDSTGAVIVRVNEVEDINISGVDTRNGVTGVTNKIRLWNSGSSGGTNPGLTVDDFYIDSSQFQGDCKVELSLPTGAGTTTQFTPSAGSNFQNVDDTSPDDDASYNSSSTVGQIDTFQMGNLNTVSGSVKAVQVAVKWRKDDAGSRTGRRVVRVGTTNYESADVAVLDTYTYSIGIYNQNPDTSSAWTISDVNALEAGYKIEA